MTFLIPDLICVLICMAAAVIDLRTRRIPNALTFPAVIAGLVASYAAAALHHGPVNGIFTGLLPSVIGSAVLVLAFLAFASVRAVGMGDVKLMAAVGAFLRWPLAIWALAFVLLAGCGLGVIYMVARGQVRAVFSNMVKGAIGIFKRGTDREPVELHHMPYALAILIGVTAAVLYRYAPLFA